MSKENMKYGLTEIYLPPLLNLSLWPFVVMLVLYVGPSYVTTNNEYRCQHHLKIIEYSMLVDSFKYKDVL